MKKEFELEISKIENNPHIKVLLEISNNLLNEHIEASFDFYSYLCSNKIDISDFGDFGCPSDILKIFENEKILNIKCCVDCVCNNCSNVKIFPKLIENIIHISEKKNSDCLQNDVLAVRSSLEELICDKCKSEHVSHIYNKEQDNEVNNMLIIILDFIQTEIRGKNGKRSYKIEFPKKYIINHFLKDKITNDLYELIATINMPTVDHFTACVKDIYYKGIVMQGWYVHDGMKNMGLCYLDKKFKDICNYNPYVLCNYNPYVLFFKKK